MIYGQPITMGGGTFVTAIHNTDGTQNILITDKKPDGSIIDVPAAADLLWENASPTSAFGEQTVSVPTGYSAYLVEVKSHNTSHDIKEIGFVPFFDYDGDTANRKSVGVYRYSGGRHYTYARTISSASDGSIAFYRGNTGGAETTTAWSDNYCIPTRIWGVKFTL